MLPMLKAEFPALFPGITAMVYSSLGISVFGSVRVIWFVSSRSENRISRLKTCCLVSQVPWSSMVKNSGHLALHSHVDI